MSQKLEFRVPALCALFHSVIALPAHRLTDPWSQRVHENLGFD